MKTGIIGCGYVAHAHIRCLKQVDGVEIVGLADIDSMKAQSLAKQFKIPRYFSDPKELLAETKPDVVHVLTPPQSHAELTYEALSSGCHVLLEKPMAPTVKEAEEILNYANKQKKKVGICHNFLYIPCIIEAKKMLDDRTLGSLVGIDITWKPNTSGLNAHWTRELPGGALNEVLPHPVYLQSEFAGKLKKIVGVSTRGDDKRGPSCSIHILMESERATSKLEVLPEASPKQMMIKIEGTKMSLHIDISSNTLIKIRKIGSGVFAKGLMNIDQAIQLMCQTIKSTTIILMGGYSNGHLPLIKNYYDCLRSGNEYRVQVQQGYENICTLDKIWKYICYNEC